ncbi:M20/M25/M40 family metallo-hydrolase [Gymnodinialimonas sp.]
MPFRHIVLVLALSMVSVPVSAGDAAVQRLAEAVRFRTISHQDPSQINYAEFERFNEFLQASYPLTFATLDVEVVGGYSLLLIWRGSDASLSPILLTAHSDVVPIEPGTEADWQYPPFAGVVAEGKIHGRGTLDDKEGVMAWLEAVESLVAERFVPRRTVVFAFGHDEEIGGEQGARAIAARLQAQGMHFAWMIDEGGMILSDNPMLPQRPVAMINVAEKGFITLTLTAKGEGGHSSQPPPVSTIGRLSRALARLEENPFPTELPVPVVAMLETMAPHMDQPERFIFNNLWLTGSLVESQMAQDRLTNSFVRTTTALTMFNAGVKENVVPQEAQAKVNFRLLPGDTTEKLVQRVTALVDDPDVEITYSNWNNIPPVSDHNAEGFTTIAAAVAEVVPDVLVVPSLLTATTDTRHYIELTDNQYRFHGVAMSSSQASSIHGTGEAIGVDSYLTSIEIARRILLAANGVSADSALR